MLDQVDVILVRPQYSANIGAVARACLNMGCTQIILVNPVHWQLDQALPLATHHARFLLEKIRLAPTLAQAVAPYHFVYGTTARIGGWRKGIQTPEQAGQRIIQHCMAGARTALVFGPENKGLTNAETEICAQLITIPTTSNLASLNLSQAVMVVLYECFKQKLTQPLGYAQPETPISHRERELLFTTLHKTLVDIDYLKAENSNYFMLPLRRFINRINPRRNEFNQLMGLCRQVQRIVRLATKGSSQ